LAKTVEKRVCGHEASQFGTLFYARKINSIADITPPAAPAAAAK